MDQQFQTISRTQLFTIKVVLIQLCGKLPQHSFYVKEIRIIGTGKTKRVKPNLSTQNVRNSIFKKIFKNERINRKRSAVLKPIIGIDKSNGQPTTGRASASKIRYLAGYYTIIKNIYVLRAPNLSPSFLSI